MNKIKKFLSVLTSVTCIGSVCTASVNACPFYDIHDNDLCYEIIDENNDGTDDYLVLANCDKHVENVVIPSEVNGLPVKEIQTAFVGCQNLKSVTIPEGVTTIGSAFGECENLETIVIPESATSISGWAFENTAWLKQKQKENPLVIVNDILIEGKTCIGEVVIPDGITKIADNAFNGIGMGIDVDIESVVIPSSVKSIGSGAFCCENLKDIVIPKSVEFIGAYAFDGTKWIKDKIAENPVVVVNDMLIDGGSCKGNVEIPDNVKYIGAGAFMGNEDIEQVTVSENVEEIHQEAFSYCTELKEIIIENPDCDIIDYDRYDVAIITNTDRDKFSGIIYGHENSTAQAYSQKHGYQFAVIGSEQIITTSVSDTESSVTTTTSVTVVEEINGDATGDSKLDVRDCAFIASAIANGISYELSEISDFNNDDIVNIRDAAAIARFLAE